MVFHHVVIIKLLRCYRMKILNVEFSKGNRLCVCVMKTMTLIIDVHKFTQDTFHILYTHTVDTLHLHLIIESCSLNSIIMFKISLFFFTRYCNETQSACGRRPAVSWSQSVLRLQGSPSAAQTMRGRWEAFCDASALTSSHQCCPMFFSFSNN